MGEEIENRFFFEILLFTKALCKKYDHRSMESPFVGQTAAGDKPPSPNAKQESAFFTVFLEDKKPLASYARLAKKYEKIPKHLGRK